MLNLVTTLNTLKAVFKNLMANNSSSDGLVLRLKLW